MRGLQICKRCPRSHFRVREVVDFADTVSKKMKNLRFITEANILIAFVLWCKHRNVELWFFLPLGRGEGSFAQPREGGRVHGRVYHSCYVSKRRGNWTGHDAPTMTASCHLRRGPIKGQAEGGILPLTWQRGRKFFFCIPRFIRLEAFLKAWRASQYTPSLYYP